MSSGSSGCFFWVGSGLPNSGLAPKSDWLPFLAKAPKGDGLSVLSVLLLVPPPNKGVVVVAAASEANPPPPPLPNVNAGAEEPDPNTGAPAPEPNIGAATGAAGLGVVVPPSADVCPKVGFAAAGVALLAASKEVARWFTKRGGGGRQTQ